MEERVQKILSRCGVASRRRAEEMIMEGLVTVNGTPAVIGMKADIEKDHIKVRGKLVNRVERAVYLLFHKPAGCLTAMDDPEGRPTIRGFMKRVKEMVFPVGRLDYHSEGLLILTNDGDLANRILHPRHKVPKTYLVKINGVLGHDETKKLESGIQLEDGLTAPARVRTVKKTKSNSWIEITVREGRKRQIRRMLQRVGHPVIKLVRTRINGLALGDLKPGEYRSMTSGELKKLRKEVLKEAED